MSNTLPFRKLIIVGGGTAGWMSACYLAKVWGKYDLDISIIESDAIGTIGVGEGTTPSIKAFLKTLDIKDEEWMPACNATYKTGIRFVNWSSDENYQSYFHPFYSQLDRYFQHEFFHNIELKHKGFNVDAHPDPYLLTSELAMQHKAPKEPENFPFDMDYAYHFDASLLAQFLKKKALEWGVKHHVSTIKQVQQRDDGYIDKVITEEGESFYADFFVDCSGFRSLLLGRTLNVPYTSFASRLLNDSAVTVTTPRESAIPSLTLSTALSSGWAWRIPLVNRFGNGYVYSSHYIKAKEAEEELRQHLGLDENTKFNHLKMRVGHYNSGWEKNVLAIGLAQGFIEPLEATALHFVTQSVIDFVDAIESAGYSYEHCPHFNKKLNNRYDCVRDYIELHYLASSKNDSDYWKAVKDQTPSLRLQRIIKFWYEGKNVESILDKESISSKLFSHESWLCLLAGKGMFPPSQKRVEDLSDVMRVDMSKIEDFVKTSAKHFPLHDEALAKLNGMK